MAPGQGVTEVLNSKMEEEVGKLRTAQQQHAKSVSARQTLDSQLNENKLVKEELDRLEEGAAVFKLVGPALVRQDNAEANSNVDKRIAYISGEIKRHDDLIEKLAKEQAERKDSIRSLQSHIQKMMIA